MRKEVKNAKWIEVLGLPYQSSTSLYKKCTYKKGGNLGTLMLEDLGRLKW